jgi:cyanophycin synthetase
MANSVTRRLLIAEAQKRGWHVEVLGDGEYFCKITHPDGRWEMFRGSRPMKSSANGLIIAQYKNRTMNFVESLGFKVPAYTMSTDEDATRRLLETYGRVVVKPVDGERTRGVSVGVSTDEALNQAVQVAKDASKAGKVIVQQQLEGNLYRLLTINGRFIAAAQRKAAAVTGDGRHNVAELIATLNADPRRGKGVDTPLKTIDVEAARVFVGDKVFEQVVPDQRVVRVSAIDSVSAGGESIDVTATVHPRWQEITTRIATEAGLFVCGYDIMCADIAAPPQDDILPLLELNSSPGLKLHEYPTGGGEPIKIAPILLDELFP